VLISEADAANNYRTPIHLLNPLTGKIEDWATIDQPTVEDTRVPYNYSKDWPRPWTTNDGGNEYE
jgi:hypothetical protein